MILFIFNQLNKYNFQKYLNIYHRVRSLIRIEESKCAVSIKRTVSSQKLKPEYYKVSIIRPGRSRLLEFEKKIVLVV